MMQKNTAVLTVICIVLCLAFNYTFPLHREPNGKWSFHAPYENHTQTCAMQQYANKAERKKEITPNIESTLKKIENSTQVLGKNIYDHISVKLKNSPNKKALNDEDVRQYEQMVIMKKYPYLDLKEYEPKCSPTLGKHVRQSMKFETEQILENEPSLCESLDIPNVEIINRGLSGFAIPPQLNKHTVVESKLRINNLNKDDKSENGLSRMSSDQKALSSLSEDIKEYEKKLNIKTI